MATSPEGLEPTAPSAAGTDRRRIVLVAVGALAVVALVWMVFLRDVGPEPGTVADTAPSKLSAEDDADDGTSPRRATKASGAVETFEVFAPKDPFHPLISAAGAAGTATTTGAATAPTENTGGITQGGGQTTPTGGSADSSEVGGHRVKVVDVYRQGGKTRAQIEVDGTVYTVDEGERFAESFQLVSGSGDCAAMLFGDDQFTLCEGEEILK